MLRAVLVVVAAIFVVSGAVAQAGGKQRPVSSMDATVSGTTITAVWTPPNTWKNPDPAHQGYLVCAYVYEPGGSIWPRVVQLYYLVGTQSCQFTLPPGDYMIQVFAHSDSYPDSIAKEKVITIP